MSNINPKRVRLLQDGKKRKGPVLYWMSRDQRAEDNWALLFAQQLAMDNNTFTAVCFSLVPKFLEARLRHYSFLIEGLKETERVLRENEIPLLIVRGEPQITIPQLIEELGVSALVADFDPLRLKRIWKRDVAKSIRIPFFEVDAHNIVPCLYLSQKMEFAAYSIRPKIHRELPVFLESFPDLQRQRCPLAFNPVPWDEIYASLPRNDQTLLRGQIVAGSSAAVNTLEVFLERRLADYYENRNDPNADAQSGLSPFLHFGQLAAQRVALAVRERYAPSEATENFLEELIVRRELSDNFCYYNTNYDSFDGFPQWAKDSLNLHRDDPREYVYTMNMFKNALTHDPLWNAAQTELMLKGKMHGYMRMYWAKKILEWSPSPEEALRTAIELNDTYSLDGRDPNGYAGCAWSIGGVHDRPWPERNIFGKIRYMNYEGCKRKFDVNAYIENVDSLIC